MSHRRAGKFHEDTKRVSRAAAVATFDMLLPSIDVIGAHQPPDELAREIVVFDANPQEIAAKTATLAPDVLLEPEILHYPVGSTTLPMDLAGIRGRAVPGAVIAGSGRTLTLTVMAGDQAVRGAQVLLFLRGPGGLDNQLTVVTKKNGRARFEFSPFWTPAAALVVPAGEQWTAVARGPRDGDTIVLQPLPKVGRRDAWWQRMMNLDESTDTWGAGVAVGVIDTGVGPHPYLEHVELAGSFLDTVHDPAAAATRDVDSHGTHVSGTIGARPAQGSNDPAGMAPGARLMAARVFPDADSGANQGDIAEAIDHLSRDRTADLINLSLGAAEGSQIEHDAILDAFERGTLCICAAGNEAGPVGFPAAFAEAVAVSALGLEGWGAPGSLSASRLPGQRDRFGNDGLYLASFSCFGPEIDTAAPGVGIIATVPERFGLLAPHGAMDGTSMASPVACGMLAALLSQTPDYLELPRDVTRAHRAREILRASCRDIGLARRFQGNGMLRR